MLREGWRGAGVGRLVEAMVEGGGEMAEEVWRAAKAHRLALATPVLVGLLERSTEVLVEEVEAFLLEGLEGEVEVEVGLQSSISFLSKSVKSKKAETQTSSAKVS